MAALPDGRLAVAYIALPDIDLFIPTLREARAFDVGSGRDGGLSRDVGEVGFSGDSRAAVACGPTPASLSSHTGSGGVGGLAAVGAHPGYAAAAHELPGLPRSNTSHRVSAGILGAAAELPVAPAATATAPKRPAPAAAVPPLFDGPGYTLQRTLRGHHHDSVFDLLVLPGGQLLSASKDRTVRRWSLADPGADAVPARGPGEDAEV
jgi:hypothetical protein